MPKQSKTTQKSHSNNTEFLFFWSSTPGHGILPWDMLDRYGGILLERVAIFPCQQVSVVDTFLVGGKALCPLLLLRAGNCSDLNLCRSWGYHHSFHEAYCIRPIVSEKHCFYHSWFLKLLPLLQRLLKLEGKSLMKTSHLELCALKASWNTYGNLLLWRWVKYMHIWKESKRSDQITEEMMPQLDI